jgi:RND family efflux transporter MFP subunit
MFGEKVKHRVLFTLFFSLFVSACDDGAQKQAAPIRAIKPFYVTEVAGGGNRVFSGAIAASGTSSLSFSVGGKITKINTSEGDRVEKGQVLAELDKTPFQYDVDAAKSQKNSADATLAKASADLARQKSLFEKGWIAKAAYDQSVLEIDSAKSDLNYARSKLSAAERDLANTVLKAPYSGLIASRSSDPFVEITPGAPVFEINSTDALEVEFGVPDRLVSRVTIGQPVTVDVSQIDGCECSGRITEIGSVTSSANSVQVKATLSTYPTGLLPGAVADIGIELAAEHTAETQASGFLVPLNAIAPSETKGQGFVFIFNEAEQVVKRVAVSGRAGRENMVALTKGVAAGDILAAAGVSFLRDGQKVKLMGK